MAGTLKVGGKVLATHNSETDEVSLIVNGGLTIPSHSTDPTNPSIGNLYYNSTEKVLKIYVTKWETIQNFNTFSNFDVFNDGSTVALYLMEDNFNDEGGRYTGTTSNVSYTNGVDYKSLYANGTSSYISVDVPMPDTWAFSFWFKEVSGDSRIFKTILSTDAWNTSGAPHHWGLRWDHGGSGKMGLIIRGVVDPFYFESSASDWATDFNHIVFQYTGAYIECWKNGVLLPNRHPMTNTSFQNWRRIMWSPWDGANGYVEGYIDNLRMLKRSLSSAEVQQLYQFR